MRCGWKGQSQVTEGHYSPGEDIGPHSKCSGKSLASGRVERGERHNLICIHKMQPDCEESRQEEGLWEKNG